MPLPTPENVLRVRLRATLRVGATPVEEAQFGFYGVRHHLTGNTVDWPTTVVTMANGVRDRWNDHITNKIAWSDAVTMDTVKVDHLEAATGKVLDQGVATFSGDDSWQGTSAASLPWECALAVSLFGYEKGVFATNKGRKRGRMYLPPMATGTISERGGLVNDSTLAALNTNFGAFFNDVQGMEFPEGGPGGVADYFDLRVVSRGTPEKELPPTTTQIKFMYIDNRYDSQRRRERSEDATSVLMTEIDHADPP